MGDQTYNILLFDSISDVPKQDWDTVTSGKTIYLSFAYLEALEGAMKSEMGLYYALVMNNRKQPVLAASFQLVTFVDKRKKYTDHLCKLSYHLHKKIHDALNINVLVCGNVFCDGENGFAWSDELRADQAMDLAEEVAIELKARPELKEKASVTLFKEFWPDSTQFSDRLKNRNYRAFMIDVNMVLRIHPDWNAFDDYLASMKTKFRTRAKSVMKKSSNLTLRSLSSLEIQKNAEHIDQLFGYVLEKSDFSFGRLKAAAFVRFKEKLADAFTFRSFELDGKMIGFSTSFLNGHSLEANYVGIDYKFNQEYAVYQRILYDYVEQALTNNVNELQLGRTAELMKSQIGALPKNMKLYVKHRKSVSNLLLGPIIHSISPRDFEIRQPFKADFSQ